MSVSINAITSIPGTGNQVAAVDGLAIAKGSTAQRLLGVTGVIRFNATTNVFEATPDGITYYTFASATGPILSITGTANRITVTAGPNPVIDISAAYIGQTSITTLGTITTGVWNGTAVTETFGGTGQTSYILGDTLYSSAANTLAKLSGNITAVKQYLSQTGTGAVSAAPIWATISGGDITGAALSKTDDTNVTMTLGGTPLTALLRATSMTLGWTGVLSLARGGTNADTSAQVSNGGIVWSNATQMQILAGTATARQMLQSGASATPAWSTSTWPATTTINQILYSSAANTVAGLATANSATLVTTSAGVPTMSGSMSNGQIIIGSTGATPTAATLTALANSGISITNAAASITIGTNGVLKSFQIFTTGTAATYTKPAGINNILVECVGGGGAGGSSASSAAAISVGSGGGSGGYCRKLITSAAGTYTYTVGAGGTPGAAGNNAGGNGAATTFSTLSAGGGGGGGSDAGSASSHTSGGGFPAGGTSSGGDINVTGQTGTHGFTSLVAYGYSGRGGNTIYGAGAAGFPAGGAATDGNSAVANSGGGGGGAISANTASNQQGGAGGSGLIIVWEFV